MLVAAYALDEVLYWTEVISVGSYSAKLETGCTWLASLVVGCCKSTVLLDSAVAEGGWVAEGGFT
jgi:hypothetical protein